MGLSDYIDPDEDTPEGRLFREEENVRDVAVVAEYNEKLREEGRQEVREAVMQYLNQQWPKSDVDQLSPVLRQFAHRVQIMKLIGVEE
jgi:hypothetical protein